MTLSDPETPEAPEAAATPPKPAGTPKPSPGLLHHATDVAARPGFRSPPNSNSKAQKNAPKGKNKK